MKNFIKKLICKLDDKVKEHRQYWQEFDDENSLSAMNATQNAIEIVRELADEYDNGWIFCSDKLPDKSGVYIVCYHKWTDGNYLPKFDCKRVKTCHYSMCTGWTKPIYFDKDAEKDTHHEILAWMPLPKLPKPYQEKG